MRGLVIAILTFFILSTLASATNYELLNHKPVLINGKTFELSGKGEEFVYAKVDGKFGKVSQWELTYVNGAWMQAMEIYEPYADQPLKVVFAISMDFECGNDECEETESKEICCTDCGCLPDFRIWIIPIKTYKCEKNQCKIWWNWWLLIILVLIILLIFFYYLKRKCKTKKWKICKLLRKK